MKILFATSEALPFAASGGLADVAGSLPKALRNHHHACRVVLPLYASVTAEQRAGMKFVASFYVQFGWRSQYCGVFEINYGGVIYYLLDNEYYFKREQGLYGYYDDAERFAFFSRAILEMIGHIDFAPDIIHCNDWQTALVPVYLDVFYRFKEKYAGIKTVFTIHNIQYQGRYGMEIAADVLGMPAEWNNVLEYDECLNMVKGAVERANAVTTVSPTYAEEIRTPWYSHGLDGILRTRSFKLRGILNGIDITEYNPETDPQIACNYTAATLEDKEKNKTDLIGTVGLDPDGSMVAGMVTRLVSHKGIDLVKYILGEMVAQGIQIAVLGSGDYIYESFFYEMQRLHPGRVAFVKGFIPAMARKFYAGLDAFLMPSKSEPCGLAQMVAARYGTISVVRETGGLKDSIPDYGDRGIGFTFKSYNAHDLLGALMRCKGVYDNSVLWRELQTAAMLYDFSWGNSAKQYIRLYNEILL